MTPFGPASHAVMFSSRKSALVLALAASLLSATPDGGMLSPPSLRADEQAETELLKQQLKEREEKLWADAGEALLLGRDKDAADLFFRFYRAYPSSPHAEEALWRTATLRRELSLGDPKADWEAVKDLFRTYSLDYPDSSNQEQAYFLVADAYVKMGYFRDALTYFGLFLKKFPSSARADEARFTKAQLLLRIGRLDDAASAYDELGLSQDPVQQIRARAGMAHIDFARRKYHDALAVYLRILREDPTCVVNDPDILLNKGVANLRVGNDEEGRRDLLQYLNMTGVTPSRSEVLFELGESYLAAGEKESAAGFFSRIVAEEQHDNRQVVLSRYRLAQIDGKAPVRPKEGGEAAGEEGAHPADRPFQEVLDSQYADPLSQGARLELLRRHFQRDELEQAFVMGKAYLRHPAEKPAKGEVEHILGDILVRRLETMLDQKKFTEIYQLYKDEHALFQAYGKGRLLYLVGRALEELALYRQAGVIYYRAMALEMSDDELLDLYFHRANTYLADNDLDAAQRLLKFLRVRYAGQAAIGEIGWLSGHLRERQQRPEDALEFYKMAVETPTFADRKGVYAADYLRQLFALQQIGDKAEILDRFAREKWLEPLDLQRWYAELGDWFAGKGEGERAMSAYRAALAVEMPAASPLTQSLSLRLGDLLNASGRKQEAIEQFQQAAKGSDELVGKLARQRLRQENINESVTETEAILKR